MITVERFHDISVGHRVVGHENKCKFLHGHNYRIHFTVTAPGLDSVGRVVDFSVIKEKLCMWLENNYDHRFLIWKDDPMIEQIKIVDNESIVVVDFNPTAENLAEYLVEEIGVRQLKGTGCSLIQCKVEETRKCSATYKKK